MNKRKNPAFLRMLICLGILVLSGVGVAGHAQATPNFSGQWKQDNDRCQPRLSSEVTLRIEHHDRDLTVETFITRSSANPQHVVQKYTTDGKVSMTTGAD